jgi:hypothetical protein
MESSVPERRCTWSTGDAISPFDVAHCTRDQSSRFPNRNTLGKGDRYAVSNTYHIEVCPFESGRGDEIIDDLYNFSSSSVWKQGQPAAHLVHQSLMLEEVDVFVEDIPVSPPSAM